MTAQDEVLPSLAEIGAFLVHEARLLDDRARWDEWLALYTEDCLYWAPYRMEHVDPHAQPSIFLEDKLLMEVRLNKLRHERSWSQTPPTRTARIVGNVVLDGTDPNGNVIARSTFHLMAFRRDAYQPVAGFYTHHLARTADGLRIRRKRVDLLSQDGIYEHILQVHI